MRPELDMNYRRFTNYRRLTRVTPYETKIVRPRAIHYGSYSEGIAIEAMVLIGLAVLTAMTVSMLVAFAII
jgi:hypothetical protein